MRYNKPPLSIDDQLTRLEHRGLAIPDKDKAKRYMLHIGYYRLSAYALPYEIDSSNHLRSHQFVADVSFDDIVDLYVFDRKLRLLVLEAIERIEVSVRSNWAHYLSMETNDPHAFLNRDNFNNHWDHQKQLSKVAKDISSSNEVFVTHYLRKYKDPYLPHIWAMAETLSIGGLSHWYKNTKYKSAVKAKVAQAVGIPAVELMDSILHCLTLLRNICAHHNRLWNRKMLMQLPNIKKLNHLIISEKIDDKKQNKYQEQPKREIYNYLVVIGHMMKSISPKTQWLQKVKALVTERSQVEQKAMGFPQHWQSNPYWQGA